MADEKIIKTHDGTFEIVSLVGTVESGNSHLHISISDAEGNTLGGHLKMGTIVGVTAEVVIGQLEGTTFKRESDKNTGFEELVVVN
jgi:predicted DNA-binding protein with PD1-like motif